jgi:hypothetical protein
VVDTEAVCDPGSAVAQTAHTETSSVTILIQTVLLIEGIFICYHHLKTFEIYSTFFLLFIGYLYCDFVLDCDDVTQTCVLIMLHEHAF